MILFLNRNIRRFVLFALGMSVFGSVMLSDLAGGDAFWLRGVFLVLLALSATFLAMMLVALRPKLRSYLELAGISGLLSTVFYGLFPGTEVRIILASLAFFVLIIMLMKLYLGSGFARNAGKKRTYTIRNSVDLPYDADDIWHFAIPGMSGPIDHVMGFAAKYRPHPDDPDTLRVSYAGGRAQYEFVFLDRKEPEFCRFYYVGSEPDGTILDGVVEISVTMVEPGLCHVSTLEERTGQPLGRVMERWFDNPLRAAQTRLHQRLAQHTFPNVPEEHSDTNGWAA